MRYLGNKTKLLSFIESVIKKHEIEGEIFADLFAGTCSIGDYFKDQYTIIANDYLKFSAVISKAKLFNNSVPSFDKFEKRFKTSPFEWLNSNEYFEQENYYVYQNYSPKGNRMYFTESNAIKIDGMRIDIEELYKEGVILENEYFFLLGSLIGSVLKISNTSGTFQAYFKFWESRALKDFEIIPLNLNETESIGNNKVYNMNTNELVRIIEGDIAYIDPPYTATQYTNSYHLLETITKYDYPEIFGITGRRSKRELSGYSNKTKAIEEFEDLFRQLQFKHILLSYSNQSIIPIDELIDLASKFAINGEVHVEANEYREYSTNNSSFKGNGKKLKEVIIYFAKDLNIRKSPLNYPGSKDTLLPQMMKHLPKHIDCFVDCMGGAFNVGANVVAMNSVTYNEYNNHVYKLIQMLLLDNQADMIREIEAIIETNKLEKKNKDSYISLRAQYNLSKSTIELFVLHLYSFQNMIRFNSKHMMNTPIGNNEFSLGVKNRIEEFKVKSPNLIMTNVDYKEIIIEEYPIGTLFYFDPPYFITKATYNDGKRGYEGWDSNKETELLNYLSVLNQHGHKFMLSNVIEHNGKQHHLLLDWVEEHQFNIISVGKTGKKYPREEVLITNYKNFE